MRPDLAGADSLAVSSTPAIQHVGYTAAMAFSALCERGDRTVKGGIYAKLEVAGEGRLGIERSGAYTGYLLVRSIAKVAEYDSECFVRWCRSLVPFADTALSASHRANITA